MTVTRIGKSPEEHSQELTAKIMKGVERGVKAMEADAKMLVGVDTGRLRASLTSAVTISNSSIVGLVGSNVEYAFFHSLQNPYLETAVDGNLEFLKQSIINEVK